MAQRSGLTQFRSVRMTALEQGEQQLKHPSLSAIECEFLSAFWYRASRVEPILISITGILHGFPTNDYPSPAAGTCQALGPDSRTALHPAETPRSRLTIYNLQIESTSRRFLRSLSTTALLHSLISISDNGQRFIHLALFSHRPQDLAHSLPNPPSKGRQMWP